MLGNANFLKGEMIGMGRKAGSMASRKMKAGEILVKKLHKETLTADDVKTIMELDKDTFDAWIKRLCELYKEMNIPKLKKGTRFSFEKEWHSIFLTLLGSVTMHPKYNRDEKKHNHNMRGIEEYHKALKEQMGKYLSEEEKTLIQQTPPYVRSEIQGLLIDEIDRKMAGISTQIQNMPEELRIDVLMSINKKMDEWQLYLSTVDANHRLKRYLERRGLPEKLKREQLAYQQSLDQMLIEWLSWSIEAKESWSGYEQVTYEIEMTNDFLESEEALEAGYHEQVVEFNRTNADETIRKLVEDTRNIIINEPSNKEIVERVVAALADIDLPLVSVVKTAMEQVLVNLMYVDKEENKKRAEVRGFIDKLFYRNVLEELNK